MNRFLSISVSTGVCIILIVGGVRAAPSPLSNTTEPAVNLIHNASFEDGVYSPAGHPRYWTTGRASQIAIFTWDDTQSHDGSKNVKIAADSPDDAYWAQTIPVVPNTDYVLSGYIKTENVGHTAESTDMGANLSIFGSWNEHSQPLFGSNEWTHVSFAFNSGERSHVTVAARLGFWSGMTTGAAWFDDLELIGESSGCDPAYPDGFFRACYFEGTDPYTAALLGREEESPLGAPVPERTFGIDHDWGNEPVFLGITPGTGGSENDISAIWRGRLYFKAGRYQFTTFARDGVRLFIDEQLLVDEWIPDEFWYRFGTVIELTEGFHNIRVEWFATGLTPESTLLRLHWDRVPPPRGPAQVSPIVIDVFLLKKQDICIVGNPWVSGERVAIYEPNGSIYRAWQIEAAADLPRTLPPSDPSLHNYAQVECFSFSYPPGEIPGLRAAVEEFGHLIPNWSGGDIQPEIHLFELEGEVNLGRIGTSWLIPPRDIAFLAEHLMTTQSDFAIVLSSNDDITTGRYFEPFGCGATYGVDQIGIQPLGGTGYSWVTCVDGLTILHEWGHQFSSAVNHLLGLESIYPVDHPEDYPPCGMGDPDIFKWFPDSEHWGVDPDSPWCGMTDSAKVGIAELHLFAHFDASLSHYPLGFFTGNHCNNGVQDFGESEVDQGANCPAEAPVQRIEEQPSDDGWVQMRSSGNHGRDRQLKIQNNLKVAYLKFDLRDVSGSVTSATVFATIAQAKEGIVSIYAVPNTDWQEETLNGRNAPAIGRLIDSVVISGRPGEAINWDVTECIRAAIAGGAEDASFALVVTNGKPLSFFSKENKGSNRAPLLVIVSQ